MNISYYFTGFLYNRKLHTIDFTEFRNVNFTLDDINRIFQEAKEMVSNLPRLLNQDEINAFCRGYFDAYGILVKVRDTFIARVYDCDEVVSGFFRSFLIKKEEEKEKDGITFSFHGCNVVDLFAKLYPNNQVCYRNMTPLPLDILRNIDGISNNNTPNISIALREPDAVMPSKQNPSDIGWDITIIKVYKILRSGAILYDTGVTVQPPHGWYVQIVPRSSFSDTGYVLANSVGIIDPSYTGSIKVPLLKVNPDCPDIELPYRGFQLILVPTIYSTATQVTIKDITDTTRSSGGFGSTNTFEKRKREEVDITGEKKPRT